MSKLNSLPMSFHQGETIGATMNRINAGITGCVTAFCETAFNLLPTLLYLALSIAAMLRMEWRLAVAVMLIAPVPALIGAWAAPEQMHRERRLVERWNSIYGRFNEVLAGMMTVKGFAMEEEEKRRFMQGVREGNEVVRRGVRTDNLTGTLRTLAATAARLMALAIGGYLDIPGRDDGGNNAGIPGLHRRAVRSGAGAHQHLPDPSEGHGIAGGHLQHSGCGRRGGR